MFEVYSTRSLILRRKQWRWRFRAENSRIIAMSSESYNNQTDCIASIHIVARPGARVEVIDHEQY